MASDLKRKLQEASKRRAFWRRCIECGRQNAMGAKVECPETLYWTRTCRYCGAVVEGERGEDLHHKRNEDQPRCDRQQPRP